LITLRNGRASRSVARRFHQEASRPGRLPLSHPTPDPCALVLRNEIDMIRLIAGKSRTNRILSAAGPITIVLLGTASCLAPRRLVGGSGTLLLTGSLNSPSAHTNPAPEWLGSGWYEGVPSTSREAQRFTVAARFARTNDSWKRF